MKRLGRMTRVPLAALACLLAAGCGEDVVGQVARGVRVSPDAVEFPRTYVGYPTTAHVTVENTGRATEELRAEVTGPYFLPEREARVYAGAVHRLAVLFDPTAPGAATGALVVEAAGERFEVSLSGTAVPAPACSTAEACETIHFDPESGTCVHEPVSGTPCSTACVANGTCLDGVCRGTDDGCDDGNVCTQDLVAADCTCRHQRYADRRTECRVETCEDFVGWKPDNAANGTACGPANECVGEFCFDGECVVTLAPEGTICRTGTPCQRASRCRRGTDGGMGCVTPAPTATLAPVWRETPGAGRQIRWDAVTDDLYVYWAECDDAGCHLVSLAPGVDTSPVDEDPHADPEPEPSDYEYPTFTRYDAEMFRGPVARDGGLVLSGGGLFSTLRDGWVEGYDTRLGPPAVFALDLAADGRPLGRGATAVNAYGDLVLLVADAGGVPRTVIAISPAGTVAWRVRRDGDVLWGLVADEDGNVYVGAETAAGGRLLSFDGAGRERFSVEATFGTPLASFDGIVLHGDGTLYATLDGARIGTRLPLLVPELSLSPLLSRTAGYLAGYPIGESGPVWGAYNLQRFDPGTAEVLDAHRLASGTPLGERSEPVLLSHPNPGPIGPDGVPWPPAESVLLSEGRGADSCLTPPLLLEWRIGNADWTCALAPGSYGGPATVLSSPALWIAHDACRDGVVAFLIDVAGEESRTLAAEGWIGAGGEPGRGARPRR